MAGLENSSAAKAVAEQKALDRLMARLGTEFPDVPRDRISAMVGMEHGVFQGSPIRDFVPIFIERVVRRRLACAAVGVQTNPDCEPGRCWSCP